MLCALFTHHRHLRHYHIVESPATCHLPCCQNSVCLWHTGIGVQMRLADPCQIIKTQHKTFCYCINRKWLRPRKRKSIFFFFFAKEEKQERERGNYRRGSRGAHWSPSLWLKMLYINSLRTLGSRFPMLIDIPIKKISRLGEEERARERRSYGGLQSKGERRGERR